MANNSYNYVYGKIIGGSWDDTVHSSISLTLPDQIENLILTNWDDPVKQTFNNLEYPVQQELTFDVYGHPTNVLLDYVQGNEKIA